MSPKNLSKNEAEGMMQAIPPEVVAKWTPQERMALAQEMAKATPMHETVKELIGASWLKCFLFLIIANILAYFVGVPVGILSWTVAGTAMLIVVVIKHRADKDIKKMNQSVKK